MKRPFTVATPEGTKRHFAHIGNAIALAGKNARNAFVNTEWTVSGPNGLRVIVNTANDFEVLVNGTKVGYGHLTRRGTANMTSPAWDEIEKAMR